MAFNKYTLLLPFLLAAAAGLAQNSNTNNDDNTDLHPCGYTGVSPWLLWYNQHRADFATEGSMETLYVPVTVKIVGTDNGTNYWPTENAFRVICEMNAQYAPANVYFYLQPGDGIQWLPNTTWYDHDWDGGDDLINSNQIPGRVNAYVVGNPAGNCGYSWQDAIVMGKGCSAPGNSTWAHEAGHHFSLPHTFLGWEGTNVNPSQPAPNEINWNDVERTDGSNCQSAGDFFCDTDPDYLSYRWPCNNDLRSTVVQQDPSGVEFRSDATLFMSYSFDQCANRFSDEQIAAIRTNIQTEHSEYLDTHAATDPTLFVDLPDNLVVQRIAPVDTASVQFNDFTLEWEAVPGARYYVVEVALQASMVPKIVTRTVIDQTSIHLNTVLPKNRLMYWRVRAYNDWDVCQTYSNVPVSVFRSVDLVATNDLERNTIVALTPNPVYAGQDAALTVTTEETMEAGLSVVDAAGRVVYQRAERLAAGENRLDVPTAHLHAGVYVVTLRNEQGVVTRRLAVTE